MCLDETSKQQVKETRQPRPPRPGSARAYDFEYQRNGVSNLFMLFAPLEGWRRVEVTQRRTKSDWAQVVRKLVDEDYAHKDRIVLVMDNLNTHRPSSLYEAFDPTEARRIAERLEIHYTPKHGSWLNMAEIELGVLSRQCLDRRIPDQEILEQETRAWQDQRNRDGIRVDWRFTTSDARIKLKSLYPSIQALWTTSHHGGTEHRHGRSKIPHRQTPQSPKEQTQAGRPQEGLGTRPRTRLGTGLGTGPRTGLGTGPRTGPQRDQRPVGTMARPHEESPRSRPTLRRTTPKPSLNHQGPLRTQSVLYPKPPKTPTQ